MIRIYSEATQSFILVCQKLLKEIMEEEMGIPFLRTRFVYKKRRYPVSLVVFERKNDLGFFIPGKFLIGINKRLMYSAKTFLLKNVIRHELAHFFTFIDHGDVETAHGQKFRDTCVRFGWDHDVQSAHVHVGEANDSREGDLASEKIISLVKKLLALASSTNPHEAQLATVKANSLLLKHNISLLGREEDETCVATAWSGRRLGAKQHAIHEILTTFFVVPVYSQGRNYSSIDVTGTRTNVDIAVYVANFLDTKLELLYLEAKKNNPSFKGMTSRNSFFKGIAKGYIAQIQTLKSHASEEESRSLIKIGDDLKRRENLVYRRLGSFSIAATSHHSAALAAGTKAGRSLSINPGIGNGKSEKTFLLDY
jgi:hypothetical protein